MDKHYFYVVECNDKTFYAGYTNNLENRIACHNGGRGAKYTKMRLPVKLIYYHVFPTKRRAMQYEYYFKQLSRKQKERYLAGEYTLVSRQIKEEL